MESTGQIILYQTKDGRVSVDVHLERETVWLNINQMSELFSVDKSGISRHIRNIFRSGELHPEATVANFATVQREGTREVTRQVDHYNLDMIISVGYRVNSKEGTRFRIWATQVLRDHLVQGFTVNRSLFKDRLQEFEQAVSLVKQTMQSRLLGTVEATGLLQVITDYAQTWSWLQQFDDDTLAEPRERSRPAYELTIQDAQAAICELKADLIQKKLATDLFGLERTGQLESIVGSLYQTFGGNELYPTIEHKAAHLLYFIIKDHPFTDGNKRIASLLFVMFLAQNDFLTGKTGERKFNDNALVALSLLTAQSDPRQKETIIRLIMNFVAGPGQVK